jgi:uroporphyrinogen decarboxylase
MIDPKLNALRLLQAVNRQTPDQVPVFLPIESGFMAEFGGQPQKLYHHDPLKMLECQAAVQKRFGGLTPLYTDFGVVTEAAAFCEIFWPDDDSPWAKPRLERIEEVEELGVPDTNKDGLFPTIMEYYEIMNDTAVEMGLEGVIRGPRGPVLFGSLRGPVVLAALVRGLTEFLIDMIENPEPAHKLVQLCTDTLIAYLEMQKAALGRLTSIFLCDDVSGLLSPRLFNEFFVPYARQIFERYPDAVSIYHCDSEMRGLTDFAPDTGAKAFHLGFMHDLGDLKARIGGRMALIGNVHPVQTLMRGTAEQVSAASRQCLDQAGPGAFALSAGGVIDRGTPPENLDALIRATEKADTP